MLTTLEDNSIWIDCWWFEYIETVKGLIHKEPRNEYFKALEKDEKGNDNFLSS